MTSLPFSFAALMLVAVLITLEIFRRRDQKAQRRIEDLRIEIDAMKWEISSLEKLKSELLTRIGSSLSRPLASVRESALELTRPLDSSPEMNQQMQRLTAEIDEIERFLNVLGEIALLEHMEENSNGTPPLAGNESMIVNVNSVVTEVLRKSTRRMTESGLSLTVAADDGILVRGNERYLIHAVTNLLNEAIRYTARGGIVSVDLAKAEDSLRLKIQCRGAPVEQVTESTLGVELARQIISAHGGWLTEGHQKGEYTASFPPVEIAGPSSEVNGL
jgi:signal transduction histidine kinase